MFLRRWRSHANPTAWLRAHRLPVAGFAVLTLSTAAIGLTVSPHFRGHAPVARTMPTPAPSATATSSAFPAVPDPTSGPAGASTSAAPSETPSATAAPTRIPVDTPVGRPSPTPGPSPSATPSPVPATTPVPVPTPSFEAYTLPRPSARRNGLTATPDGSLWTADAETLQLLRRDPAGNLTTLTLPGQTPTTLTLSLATGPTGDVWVAARDSVVCCGTTPTGGLYRVTLQGVVTSFTLPSSPNPYPSDVAPGPDGAMWFTQPDASAIGRITADGTITEFPVSSKPMGITAGPDGALWFTSSDTTSVGRLAVDGSVRYLPSPGPQQTQASLDIVSGPGGDLWIGGVGLIVRMTTSGGASVIDTPTPQWSTQPPIPSHMVTGPDGNLWFADPNGNAVGVVTAGRNVQEFEMPDTVPSTYSPQYWPVVLGLTVGADGHLWAFQIFGGICFCEPDRLIRMS